MDKKIILSLAFIVLSAFSFSQPQRSIQTIQELTDSIEKIIQEEHITGLMLGITTSDSVLFSSGFGYADISTKRKVDENTLFRLGSVTKMFISLGIMNLVNEGKLKLTDELAKLAPEVPFKNEWESSEPVRIVHLLEHTSGFDDIKLNRFYTQDTSMYTDMEMMLMHQHSMISRWKPGERQAYSNPNYAILGYILHKLSGKPYDQYLTETILKPLGMLYSNFNVGSKTRNDIKEYVYKNGQLHQVPSVISLCGPSAALWSNTTDMTKFLQLFLRNGAPLFSKQTIDEIETTHSKLCTHNHLKSTYALGNFLFHIKGKYPWRGHAGLTGTCYSGCYYNRELNMGFIISSNSNKNNTRIEELIMAFVEQNRPAVRIAAQTLDKKEITPFLGFYQFDSPRNEISGFVDKLQNFPQIYLSKDKLYFQPWMGEPTELIQVAPLTFALREENTPSIQFTINSDGEKCMLKRGNYFEKASGSWGITKRIVLVVALLFLLSSIVVGIFSLIAIAFRKLKWQELILKILPMIGFFFLIWALYNLMDVQLYTYKLSELGTINYITLAIFLGTLLFGLLSLINLFLVVRGFKKMERWTSYYLLFAAFSMLLIAVVLWNNGWIGIRTWLL